MHASRRISLAIFAIAAIGYGATAFPAAADGLTGLTPAQEARGSIAKTRGVLAPYRTRADMIEFVGAHPRRCTQVPRGAAICVWPLSNRERGWQPLADALYTGDRLNLICEFPADKAPRAEDSCSVHSQRSNRRYYRGQLNSASSGGRGPRSAVKAKRVILEFRAEELVAAATTAFALSTLVGDAPWNCSQVNDGSYCTWKTTADTYGHGTLAMSIGADLSKKIRMSCKLPANGSPRAPDACTVGIGD